MSELSVGVGTYVGDRLVVRTWADNEGVSIGKYCSIADNVELFCGGAHRTSLVSTWPFDPNLRGTSDIDSRTYKTSKPTVIGHDVWIASGAIIMPGLTIGNGAVIGPRAVVFRDVEPYEIVRGNPAEHVRYRHRRPIVDALLSIAWWHWPQDAVEARLEDFYLPVEEFVRKYSEWPEATGSIQAWGDNDYR